VNATTRQRSDPALAAQRGFVVVELVAGIACLVLPVALLVLSLPGWTDRQSAARVAAREAGRTIARDGRCAPDTARRIATTVGTNLGVPRRDLSVSVGCAPGSVLPAGGAVTVAVTVRQPGVRVPGLGRMGEWSFTARHAEPVDRYAGVP
jgi:type II secretory pathway pseudopilin PulG